MPAKTGETTMTKQQIRTIIRTDAEARGCGRYKINASGEAHYYGTMPNTNTVGWYFAGYADELAAQINREMTLDQRV